MMNSMKRVIGLGLSAVIAAGMVSGCGNSSATSTASPTATAAAEKKGASWTWDTTPLTVSMFVMDQSYSKRWDTANNLLDQKITQDTGVSLDITSGNVDRLNVMIASDSLTDIVAMEDYNAKSQRLQLEGGNRLFALNELIPKYAPDFNPPKSMADWYRNTNGNWYTFVGWYFAPEQMTKDNYYSTHNYTMVRKDLMEQLGLKREDFETQDGMLAALKKVKTANMQYKGTAVSPYYSYADVTGKNTIVWDFAEQMGMPFENKDGTLADRYNSPKMLEAAKYANKLYREGVLPEDYFTLKADQIKNKIKSGSVFAYTRAGDTTTSRSQLYGTDSNASYVFIKPLKGLDNSQGYIQSSSPTGWYKNVISKKAKNPDRIIRFFNYMYTEEAQLNEMYGGNKGTAWNLVDGHVQYTDQYNNDLKNDPKLATSKYGKASFSFWQTSIISQKYGPVTPGFDKTNTDEFKTYVSPYIYNSTAFQDINPAAGSEDEVLYKKIDEYHKAQIVKMVLAKSPEEVESIFAETSKKLDEVGWKKIYDLMNKNFQANKTKLGLKYAYPANK